MGKKLLILNYTQFSWSYNLKLVLYIANSYVWYNMKRMSLFVKIYFLEQKSKKNWIPSWTDLERRILERSFVTVKFGVGRQQ